MSAAEPDWLTAMRNTIDGATANRRPDVTPWRWSPADVGCTVRTEKGAHVAELVGYGDAAHIAKWCPDNARRLLARHDQLQEHADRMADALAEALADPHATEHRQWPDGRGWCRWCKQTWPCPSSGPAEALRQYRDATNKEDAP